MSINNEDIRRIAKEAFDQASIEVKGKMPGELAAYMDRMAAELPVDVLEALEADVRTMMGRDGEVGHHRRAAMLEEAIRRRRVRIIGEGASAQELERQRLEAKYRQLKQEEEGVFGKVSGKNNPSLRVANEFGPVMTPGRVKCPEHNVRMAYDPAEDRFHCTKTGCKKTARKKVTFKDDFAKSEKGHMPIYRGPLQLVEDEAGTIYLYMVEFGGLIDLTEFLKQSGTLGAVASDGIGPKDL